MVGSCKHGNVPSGSIKYGEFLDNLSELIASQEGLLSGVRCANHTSE